MGTVYRARDPVLDRLVALKTIAPGQLARPDALARFQREARAAARLQHPNIVTIYELGEVSGSHYIAMELLDGVDLGRAMAAPGRLSVPRKLRIVIELCRGLDYAHKHGVLHRDVKPANVLLLEDGSVKIVDFGIARLDDLQMTRAGVIMGTPPYVAPEMLLEGRADHRSDMWAAGILLFELLAGRRPFDGPDFSALAQSIIHDPVPALDLEAPGTPAGVQAVVETALAKEPARRFPGVAEMADALQRALEAGASAAGPAVADTVRAKTVRRRRALEDLRARGAAAFRELALFGEPPNTSTACLSPVQDVLALAGTDGAIRLWDLRTRMRIATLRTELHGRSGHDAVALCMAFAPDGRLLASGHVDGALHLWDVAGAAEVPVKLRHEGLVASAAFSPDGAVLASGGMDSNLKLWEVASALRGEARRELHRQPAGVTALAYAGERGGWLVTGHTKAVMRLLDARTGRLLAALRGPEAQINLLLASADGARVAAASHDRSIRVFDLGSRSEVFRAVGHRTRPTASLAFVDDAHLAGVAQDNAVQLWDTASGSTAATLWGQAGESYTAIAVFGGGECLAAALADGRVRVWSREVETSRS